MTLRLLVLPLALIICSTAGAQTTRSAGTTTITVQPLPRGSGPVRLGMPSQNFARIAHVIPDCTKADQCGPHETRASAFIDTMPPEMAGGLPGMQQFTAYFIRDSLFAFTMRPPDRRLATVRAYYSGLYGAPVRQDTLDDGSGQLIWETHATQLIVHYARNATPKGPPPGTVNLVEYVDVRLSKIAEKDRGDRPWP